MTYDDAPGPDDGFATAADSELVSDETRELRDRDEDDDLPVVARLMIEIRSDGRRTVARGAIEDVTSAKRTAVVARGSSPVRLAVDLTRAIMRLPGMAARGAVRGLLSRRGGR